MLRLSDGKPSLWQWREKSHAETPANFRRASGLSLLFWVCLLCHYFELANPISRATAFAGFQD